ncbi:SIT4 phosphatase-associated protein-domain-containing protein [Syncephalis fuscata]|nr:SIT4 phosphatase-associated protein-domain-containing protein [Syncephalis fuscata]
MLWRFGFNTVSAIDQLLEKDDVTLEELLDEEDLLQECKSHNLKLVEFLSEPAQLEKLLNYIINEGEDEKERIKYPYLASEVIACEIWSVCEAIVGNRAMLQRFWNFLSRPAPLNPHQASYFSKVIGVLLQKKTTEVLGFIKSQPKVLSRFLEHIATSAVMDLLLKIISMEEIPDGHGVVEWLNNEGLMSALIGRLDPHLDPDVHAMAAQVLLDIITISQSSNPEQPSIVNYMLDASAPNSTSTLVNGVAIFIELIRRNYNDMEDEDEDEAVLPPVDLSDLIRVLSARLPEFQQLLVRPKSVPEPVDTTMGRRVPLGFERLRVCELFAELLHLSNMTLLNIVPAQTTNANTDASQHESATIASSIGSETNETTTTENTQSESSAKVGDTTSTTAKDTESKQTSPMSTINGANGASTLNPDDKNTANTDAASTNNATTSVSQAPAEQSIVTPGDALKLKFIETGVLTTCLDLFFDFPWNNFLHTVVYDMVHQVTNLPLELGCNRELIISLFCDAQITRRIAAAQRQNDYSVEQPKGVRLGYMGHLTFIADQVVRLLERSIGDLGNAVEVICAAEDWQEYVGKTLRDTKERDRQQLGGQRPNTLAGLSMLNLVGNDDDDDDDDDDEGGGVLGGAGSSAADWPMISDLPDKFGSSDEDEDDADDGGWLGEVDFDAPNPFDSDGGLVSAELLGHTTPLRLDMEDSDDENDVGEDIIIDDEEDIRDSKRFWQQANTRLSASPMSDASLRGMLVAPSRQSQGVAVSGNPATQDVIDGQLVTMADWKLGVQRSALAANSPAVLLSSTNMEDEDDEDDVIEEEEMMMMTTMIYLMGSFGSEDQECIHMSVAMKPTLDANGETITHDMLGELHIVSPELSPILSPADWWTISAITMTTTTSTSGSITTVMVETQEKSEEEEEEEEKEEEHATAISHNQSITTTKTPARTL